MRERRVEKTPLEIRGLQRKDTNMRNEQTGSSPRSENDLVRIEALHAYGVRGLKIAVLVLFFAVSATTLLAKVTGGISGTVRDPQGAVVPDANVQLRNVQTGVIQTIVSDSAGFYSFPAVDVGTYEIAFNKAGFAEFRETNLIINVDTSLQVDANLQVGSSQEHVTVTATAARVDTETNQIGEVIGEKEMTDLPLNGRAFTDLLALQPGVVPISTSQYGDLLPANYLNNGLLSMGGARDVNSGFMVNGANVVEGFGAGTTVVPNLDSIGEFRIITSNAGAEYGNYAGGQVNVVTKSGTNEFHGDAFEFLRNTDLDARNFFSPTRGPFDQNQFEGTVGDPIRKNKVFFFADYQGTRSTQGIDTGEIPVPSLQDRSGNLSDVASSLTGTVTGSYWANQLSQKLGYGVTAGEPYYFPGCSSSAQCVLPNATIPRSAWSAPAANLLQYIPAPNNPNNTFATSFYNQTLQDDKGAFRLDGTTRWGMLSAYYFLDGWSQNRPYPVAQGGANVPGFNALNAGRAQLLALSDTKTFGSTAVNEFHFSFMRDATDLGQPVGGVRTSP